MNGLALDLGWVARATGGRLLAGDPARPIGAIVTDSRIVQPGDLFVALRGPRFDAHQFVPDVLAADAAGALVTSAPPASTPLAAGLIEVGDTLIALQDLARAIRIESGSTVVAITGSAGKTTTKEAIAACLSTRFRVVRNKGNLNNHIGLPLSLTALRTRPDVAVMELGMNHPGEIRTLVGIARPEIRVWTNVGDAHLGFFASADAIADAKAELLEGADVSTVLVCNGDDPRILARIGGFPGRVITFGESAAATVRAEAVEDLGLEGVRARVTTPAGGGTVTTRLLGRGNLSNVLAAIAVATERGVPFDAIAAQVATLTPAPRRGDVKALRDGIHLVDDSYNSSPAALRRTLDALASVAGRRRVAVLGEMLELGEQAVAMHEASGRAVAEAGIARLFTIGGIPARALADAAVAAGLARESATVYPDSQTAAPAVVRGLAAGDVVLVKGSRGIRTDIVADRIAAELG